MQNRLKPYSNGIKGKLPKVKHQNKTGKAIECLFCKWIQLLSLFTANIGLAKTIQCYRQ
jgi:hypothetical protein